MKRFVGKYEHNMQPLNKQTTEPEKAKSKLNSLYRYLILDRYTQHKVIQKQDEKNSSCR